MGIFAIRQVNPNMGTVAGITINHSPVTVSFFFGGGNQFRIFGYTSPGALVSLEAMSSYDDTRAAENGYFEFTNRFSPIIPQETCLTAQDQFGRVSNPLCLPPFPNDYYVEIGPIILPPTLSFDKTDYFVGDEVILSGQTIPNTDVNLNMFSREQQFIDTLSLNFPKSVEAFTFPRLETKSDEKGNYAISLPSTSSKAYRLFTQTNFESQTSPNSLTLQYKILPVWMIIIKFILFIWSLIKPRLLEISILIEMSLLLHYLFKYYFHPYYLMKNKAIVLRKQYALVLEEHQLVKRENYLPEVT